MEVLDITKTRGMACMETNCVFNREGVYFEGIHLIDLMFVQYPELNFANVVVDFYYCDVPITERYFMAQVFFTSFDLTDQVFITRLSNKDFVHISE